MSATSLKLHYEPQFGICIFMDRIGSQVVFRCMCTAHCLTLTHVMSSVRRTTTLSFPYRILLIFVFAACESIVTGNPHMGNESTFLPALMDAFKNQSSYGARLEFQCTVAWSGQCWCLGRHNSPARTQHGPLRPRAVGRQGNGGTSRWVGPGWWQEGGAATCSRSSSSSSQHA